MSVLAAIGNWAKENLPTVIAMVRKTASFVEKASAAVGALLEGKDIFVDDEDISTKIESKSTRVSRSRPSFDEDVEPASQSHIIKLDLLSKEIDQSKQKLLAIDSANEVEHKRIQLQIDVMELIIFAQTFDRIANNIHIHAANLQIHLQTIQNTAGLLDSVNRQRVAIKALMQTVNHLIGTLRVSGTVKMISGIDVEWRPGNISIYGAYEAFENTRELLLREIDSFSGSITEQLSRVESVRANVQKFPVLKAKIEEWLKSSVVPHLSESKAVAIELRSSLTVIPKMETNLRNSLGLEADTLSDTESEGEGKQ